MLYNKGLNQEIIQEWNQSLVLQTLRKEGLCSRAHLAQLTELKQATVTNITKDLIDWGLIKETGVLDGNKKRRAIGITMNNENYRMLGIRISRTSYKIGIFDLSGNQLHCIEEHTSYPPNMVDITCNISHIFHALIDQYSAHVFLAIGIAIPGSASDHGRNTDEWYSSKIKEVFESEFRMPVFLVRDFQAGAFANAWLLNSAFHKKTLLYVNTSEPLAAGVAMDDHIRINAPFIAGDIGHLSIDVNGKTCSCGSKGCLHLYASVTVLLNHINKKFQREPSQFLNTDQVRKLISKNDPICTKYFLEVCRYFGFGIATLVSIIHPDIIVLDGELSAISPSLMQNVVSETIKGRTSKDVWEHLTIQSSTSQKDDILLGAAVTAIHGIFEKPRDIASNIYPAQC